jgi:hypothetical protein
MDRVAMGRHSSEPMLSAHVGVRVALSAIPDKSASTI